MAITSNNHVFPLRGIVNLQLSERGCWQNTLTPRVEMEAYNEQCIYNLYMKSRTNARGTVS